MEKSECEFEKGRETMEEDGMEGAASPRIWEDEYIERMSSPWQYDYKFVDVLLWKDPSNKFIHEVLTEEGKKHFLKVPIRDLDYLCRQHYAEDWLLDMLVDATMFFRLHNKWEVHICPSPECRCWFTDDDSLILHLIREHHYAWPCLQREPIEDQTEDQSFAEALHSTVWKPIDVEAAKGVAARLSADPLGTGTLDWPLSEDSARSKLLEELQQGFQVLLDSQQHDCLRALIAVASDIILRHLDPSNNMPLPFRTRLCCSPLCIRFMDTESLSCFVELVKDLQGFLRNGASQSTELEGDGDCDANQTKDECLDAISFSDCSDCFLLDGDKICGNEGIGVWLVEAPIFPMFKKAPVEASSILQQAKSMGASLSEHLRTVSMQSSLKSAGLTSCFKLWNMGHWPMPLFGTMPSELALECEPRPATVNLTLSSSWYSATEPAKRRKIACDSQMMQHRLELIKLTYKLQVLESRVRGLCAVDLRTYILPLLQSSLRMKLYMFMRQYLLEYGADSGHITEGSQEQQSQETVHTTVKGEPAADVGSGATTPYPSKKSEESSCTPLEFVSGRSSMDGGTELDCMVIDGEETPGASVGASMDGRPSSVTNADAASVKGRNISATAAMAAIPGSDDAMSEPEAESEPLWSKEYVSSLLGLLEMNSDKDSIFRSEGGSEDRDEGLEDQTLFVVDPITKKKSHWEIKDKVLLETKDGVLFIRMTITDVVKHCLERSILDGAKNIWEWRTYMTWECWRCFYCNKRFPDEKSHISHMVSVHQLGLSWDHYCLVPSQVWQGLTGLDEDAKKRTLSLDDSVTVDHSYRRFLVKMPTSSIPCEDDKNLEQEEPQKCNLFESKVEEIRGELGCLKCLFDRKEKQCYTSDAMALVDTEIVQHFARLEKLKQDLSGLCFYDCKKDILPHINLFLQKHNLMGDNGGDGGLWSWACERFYGLLRSVRCSFLRVLDSFSTQLEPSGKVIINIEHDNSEFGFAYYALSWKFDGPMPSNEKMRLKGSFVFSGMLLNPDGSLTFDFDRNAVLDNCVITDQLLGVRFDIMSSFTASLDKKMQHYYCPFKLRTVPSTALKRNV